MSVESAPAVDATRLVRAFGDPRRQTSALRGVSLSVLRGETVAIMGPSGSGKSTLLYVLAGLDMPDAGTVRVAGTSWDVLSGSARAQFRRRNCGFIAQGMSLLPQATAAENIEIPMLLDGIDKTERKWRVAHALDRVGLTHLYGSLIDELSGGEQQRVAIARALVLEPTVVFADEPTSNLDSITAQSVTELLIMTARERNASVVLVTHDAEVARHADRIIAMHSGELV